MQNISKGSNLARTCQKTNGKLQNSKFHTKCMTGQFLLKFTFEYFIDRKFKGQLLWLQTLIVQVSPGLTFVKGGVMKSSE